MTQDISNRKEEAKTTTNYSYNFSAGGMAESVEITAEENIIGRHAILVKFFEERWRTPKDVIECLEKIVIIIKRDFKE